MTVDLDPTAIVPVITAPNVMSALAMIAHVTPAHEMTHTEIDPATDANVHAPDQANAETAQTEIRTHDQGHRNHPEAVMHVTIVNTHLAEKGQVTHPIAPTIVIANGQFINGLDVVPRGHPGDGRLEIQVYALNPSERLPMRRRLRSGTHLPHPRIVCTTGRTVEVVAPQRGARGWSLTVDGRPADAISPLNAAVRPKAFRLLV